MNETVLGRAKRELQQAKAYAERKRRALKAADYPAVEQQAQKQLLSADLIAESLELKTNKSINHKAPKSVRPLRRSVTFRCDGEVLAWLKADGNGYQSRINAILRRAMLDASKQNSLTGGK